jgi:hypothetical protein
MQLQVHDERPRPPALPLVFTTVAFAGVAFFSWLVVAIGSTIKGPFTAHGVDLWLLLLLVFVGPMFGSATTYASRRWWPFFTGLAITLVPIVLALLLIITAPSSLTGAD